MSRRMAEVLFMSWREHIRTKNKLNLMSFPQEDLKLIISILEEKAFMLDDQCTWQKQKMRDQIRKILNKLYDGVEGH